MFMKIFTVLIISFNNIFTIPQNINNDEMTTQSLIRNKIESNKVYNFEIKNLEKVNFWILNSTNSVAEVNIYKKDNSNLNEKLPELKNLNDFTFQFTKELQNNQDKQEKIRNLITTHGQKIKENSTYKTWVINKKITIKAHGTDLYNFKDFFDKTNYRLNETNNFEIKIEKDSTDIELPTTITNFDGNHNYSDVIDNLDYLMIHRGDFDKFNYSYLYWTPVFNFIDTLEKGYYKEFMIKNHGFKDESYFYHKNSTILPDSEIIDPTNATKIEVIKKIKKKLNEAINNLTGVNNAIEGIDYNTEIKDNDNNYLDERATFDLTTDNVADRTFTVKFTATETSTQLQGTNTIKMVIPKQEDTNDNVLKIKAFNKTLIAGNNYLQLLHGETEIWKYDTKKANDYYLIKYLFGTLNYLNVKFSFLRHDPELRNDIYLYFKNNIPSINSNNYKNTFDEIYEILGNFFASLFYATFDMDEKTHTEIDFKSVENYKKDYFIQIGFFYRSLITFYPKKYLINVTGNSELLLRSYFFTFDKKTHQENYTAIKNNNSIYQIEFNVLKSYDNKLIALPTNKTVNSINYLNTDIDIRYGINIFTLTFPLYNKDNTPDYNFKIYDFNVLNSTAFIPDGSNNSEWDDLIPPANCKYSGRWIPTFNDIGCAIQNAGIKMINWILTASQIIAILRPLAIIAKATVNFSTAIFPIFKTVPAFYYTFQFLIGFAIFLMILRIFV
ncbi:hypothetical protein [Spiroplasma endosymbiont of Dromius quadrimaculatus]|uniref:hypothetical protein n=1 Tax=Spiroplasma endosymbiont of Dromius quadrimaculatus TaxID=3066283 RepID=UPI00313F1991